MTEGKLHISPWTPTTVLGDTPRPKGIGFGKQAEITFPLSKPNTTPFSNFYFLKKLWY